MVAHGIHDGTPAAMGHHYCIDSGDEYGICCRCGDARPYRMVLARQCPAGVL